MGSQSRFTADRGNYAPLGAQLRKGRAKARPFLWALPDHFDFVVVNLAIGCHQGEAFDFGLGDEEAVEGVAVVHRQRQGRMPSDSAMSSGSSSKSSAIFTRPRQAPASEAKPSGFWRSATLHIRTSRDEDGVTLPVV